MIHSDVPRELIIELIRHPSDFLKTHSFFASGEVRWIKYAMFVNRRSTVAHTNDKKVQLNRIKMQVVQLSVKH